MTEVLEIQLSKGLPDDSAPHSTSMTREPGSVQRAQQLQYVFTVAKETSKVSVFEKALLQVISMYMKSEILNWNCGGGG